MKKSFLLCGTLIIAGGLQIASAGDITGKIKLNGNAPAEIAIDPGADPKCSTLAKGKTTRHYRVGADKGLADVVVFVKGAPAGTPSTTPVLLDQVNCEYTPYILAAQAGQPISVRNSDPVFHNVHSTPAVPGNPEKNVAQATPGKTDNFVFSKPEPFLRFKCEAHQWMFAYVYILDNPYFAVTDKDGNFTIKNVPDGKYTLVMHHRKANGGKEKTQEVTVGKDPVKVDGSLDAPAGK